MSQFTEQQLADVPGFEARYRVSRDGVVFGPKGRPLSPSTTTKGYLEVVLYDDAGKRHTMKVHRLVAMAFVARESGQDFVNHLDGVKTHNSVGNLEWCTASHNVAHAYKTGLITPARGERHGSAKLTAAQVRLIRRVGSRVGSRVLAKRCGVSAAAILKVRNGITWMIQEGAA